MERSQIPLPPSPPIPFSSLSLSLLSFPLSLPSSLTPFLSSTLPPPSPPLSPLPISASSCLTLQQNGRPLQKTQVALKTGQYFFSRQSHHKSLLLSAGEPLVIVE